MFNRYADAFAINSGDASTVIKTGGWQAGDIAVFEDLAKTLTRIKDEGLEGFYQGDTARLLIEEMESGGGIIKQKDLDDYRAIWRQPLAFQYRGYDVISMPPPSSGGVALAQLLG